MNFSEARDLVMTPRPRAPQGSVLEKSIPVYQDLRKVQTEVNLLQY